MREIFLTCVFFCLLANPCAAGQARFTVNETDYTVNVPENWSEESLSDGVQMTRSDRQASIALAVFPNDENVKLANFQQSVLSSANLTDMKKVEKKNTVIVTGTKQTIPYTIVLTDFPGYVLACVASGVEKKILDGVIRSFKAEASPQE